LKEQQASPPGLILQGSHDGFLGSCLQHSKLPGFSLHLSQDG